MSDPACPNCGGALRWIGEHNAWGCDRCRTMHRPPSTIPGVDAPRPSVRFAPARPGVFATATATAPPAPQTAPQPPALPAPQVDYQQPLPAYPPYYESSPPYPAVAGAPRRNWLMIALLTAMIGVVVVLIAVVAGRGDGERSSDSGKPPDGSSPSGGGTPVATKRDCASAMRTTMAKSRDVLATMQLGPQAAADIEQRLVRHCIDDRWPDRVIACIEDTRADDTARCLDELPAAQRERVSASLSDAIAHAHRDDRTAATPPGPRPTQTHNDPLPPEDPAPPAADIPAACRDLAKQLGEGDPCPNAAASLQRMRKAFGELDQTWRALPKRPASTVQSFDKSCRDYLDAIALLRRECGQ